MKAHILDWFLYFFFLLFNTKTILVLSFWWSLYRSFTVDFSYVYILYIFQTGFTFYQQTYRMWNQSDIVCILYKEMVLMRWIGVRMRFYCALLKMYVNRTLIIMFVVFIVYFYKARCCDNSVFYCAILYCPGHCLLTIALFF